MSLSRSPDVCSGRLAEICQALSETERQDMGERSAFTVREKKFAYFLNDHHGDEIVSVCFKAPPGDNVRLKQSEPQRFYVPAYRGNDNASGSVR